MSHVLHGETKTKLYRVWQAMKDRANIRTRNGERCQVCKDWKEDFLAFKEFALSNGWNENLKVCRIGDKGDYSPDNVRFDTQQSNMQEAHAKTYKFLSPKGDMVEIFNMSKFCRDNDLRKSCMFEIYSENHCRKSHKGWRKHVDG